MLLAGQLLRPGPTLPPSERNYSQVRLSRWRYPHRVSEAAGGVAEAALIPPAPPHALDRIALSAWPPLPPLVAWAVSQRTNAASAPGVPQDLPERQAARVPGRCQELPAAPHTRAPSRERRWPRGALASESRTSERRRSAKGLKERVPIWSPRSASARTAPLPLPSSPRPALRAPRRPGTGGHADPPARDGFPSRTAHARQSELAEAVVPGSALRAAVISNCPAPGRRRRVGRGFPVAAWRYPGARGSHADETTASPCSIEACRDRSTGRFRALRTARVELN